MPAATAGVGAVATDTPARPRPASTASAASGPGCSRAARVAAEQAGRRGRPRPGQGQKGEGRRRQRPEHGGLEQGRRIDGEQGRHGDRVAEQPAEQKGRRRPGRQPDRHPQGRQGGDADQEHVADQGPLGAQGLQDGDGGLAALQIARHRPVDAQAAGQEGGQTDEAEEIFQLVDQPAQAGRGVVAVADPKAAVGKGPLQRLARGDGVGAGGQGDPHGLGEQAVGPDQPGRFHRRMVDHHAGAEGEAGGQPVGLLVQHSADGEARVAEADGIADLQAQAVQQGLFDRGAPVDQSVLQAAGALQGDGPGQGIGGVDAPHLDQPAGARGGPAPSPARDRRRWCGPAGGRRPVRRR